MNHSQRRIFEFDPFRLDPDERELKRDGETIPLTPKVFDVLLMLVEKSGHTVSKHELMEGVWSDSFVEENSLSRNISILRKTLGEPAGNGSYITTVPKRGYRFNADVRVIIEDVEELIVENRTNYSLTFRSHAPNPSLRRRLALTAGLFTIVLLGMAWLLNLARGDAVQGQGVSEEAKAEAFELYQRGRKLWQNRSAAGLHEATLLLEEAVKRDPNLAIGHAALADAYAFDARNWKKAEQAARRAIDLDPTIGEPYASIGFVRLFWQWDMIGAEEHFKKSISLSPDYATAHQWYGILLAAVGHFNEAFFEMSKALELEQTSVAINADMCQVLYFIGRDHEAEAQCKRTLEIDPNFFSAHSHLYAIYSIQGREREALEAFLNRERIAVNAGSLPADFEQYRMVFERGGLPDFWREHIRLRRRYGSDCGVEVAWVYAALGEKNNAIACLHRAVETREFGLVFVYADPMFRRLGDSFEYDNIADRLMRSQLSRSGDSAQAR